MIIDRELVKSIAKTARLKLTEAEMDDIEKNMNEVVSAFSVIEEIDVDDIPSSIQPVKLRNALREDKPGKCLSQSEALSLTKNRKDGYFIGPKAV